MNLLLESRHDSPGGQVCFREFAPSGALRAHVACFWTFSAGAPRLKPCRVLPDGCADIIFNLQPRSPSAVVIGPMIRSRQVMGTGTRDLGVRFFPGAAPIFLGHPLLGLQEHVIPLANFWGAAADRILDQLLATAGLTRQIAIVENYLREKLSPRAVGDGHVTQAIKWIYAERGRLQVRQVAKQVGLCERQLQRKFSRWTGYTPKEFVRVMRFQHALETLLRSPRLGDAGIAALHGYADQSHMIHEFHDLGNGSPRTFPQAVRGLGAECPIFSIPTPGTLSYDLVP